MAEDHRVSEAWLLSLFGPEILNRKNFANERKRVISAAEQNDLRSTLSQVIFLFYKLISVP